MVAGLENIWRGTFLEPPALKNFGETDFVVRVDWAQSGTQEGRCGVAVGPVLSSWLKISRGLTYFRIIWALARVYVRRTGSV
jgi:hypothetical protein